MKMNKGSCPDCNTPVSLSWFRAFCRRCDIELCESRNTRAIQATVYVMIFILGSYYAKLGTPDIIAVSSEDEVANHLFIFYSKIVLAMFLSQFVLSKVIAKYFAIYESKNT